ncbi:MAG: J domain-containing protein [Isosphaeraceae bacterium]
MSRNDSGRDVLPRGVTALRRPRGGRGFRASIRRGKAGELHLGLYATPWLAAFAHNVAAGLLGRERRPVEIPRPEQPTPDQVREITARVQGRLGLGPDTRRRSAHESPPAADELLAFFEVTVVGFWRGQASADDGDHPGAGLDAAAGRLLDAARLLFWRRGPGDPEPNEAIERLVSRRLDQAFRRADVTREVLDDDSDEPLHLARWLVLPDESGGRVRSFRQEVRHLYPECFEGDGDAGPEPGWARVLGLAAPYTAERVRAAYRARSREVHPDAGGSQSAFLRLREAYEEAIHDAEFLAD